MSWADIELSSLEYKVPTANRSGGKVVNVSTRPGSTDFKDRIRFQLSETEKDDLPTAVWGLSTPLSGQDATRRTLELTIESSALLKFLEDIDAKNIDTAITSTQDWFKKSLDPHQINNMYVKLVKEPAKVGAKPTVRVKVKCGDYPTNIFVVEGEGKDDNLNYRKGSPEDLTRDVRCLVRVETVGLWFMSRQFGMSLTATDILVWPTRRTTGIGAFCLASNTKLNEIVPEPTQQADDVVMDD